MGNDFNIILPLKKTIDSDELTGIASTISIDRDGERMSQGALQMMVEDIKKTGVNLFLDHDHSVKSTMGFVYDANMTSDNKVSVKIKLDDPITNQNVPAILNKLKRGIRLGLSVGGNVESTKDEYDKKLGRKVKVLDKVKIYEISVVGVPSNADAFLNIPDAIMKSVKSKLQETKTCPICYSDMNKECPACLYKSAMEKSYKIIRFRRGGPSKTMQTGLTLEEAQAHCSREDTHGEDWFDGYTEE